MFFADRHALTSGRMSCKHAVSVQLEAAFSISGQACDSRRPNTALKQQGVTMGWRWTPALDTCQRAAAGVEAQVLHTTDSWHILAVSPNALAP